MTKTRNYYLEGSSEYLKRMYEEYQYIGRECSLGKEQLVVYALPQKWKSRRDKRRERQNNRR